MCQKCVEKGIMTQEEFQTEVVEGKELVSKILSSLNGKETEFVLNILLSCVINVTRDSEMSEFSILEALIDGFKRSEINEAKEIRH